VRRSRFLLIPVALVMAGAGLTACQPGDVQPPPGGCAQQHAGWVTTQPNRYVYPFGLQEIAQVTVKAGWFSSGWGVHCSGWQVGDPFMRPGSECSGTRVYPGMGVNRTGGCGAYMYEGGPWSVTWQQVAGIGYFWNTGDGGSGVMDVMALMKAHNNTAAMEHHCWYNGNAPTNTTTYCRHQHEW
jgi:hypothetical protein